MQLVMSIVNSVTAAANTQQKSQHSLAYIILQKRLLVWSSQTLYIYQNEIIFKTETMKRLCRNRVYIYHLQVFIYSNKTQQKLGFRLQCNHTNPIFNMFTQKLGFPQLHSFCSSTVTRIGAVFKATNTQQSPTQVVSNVAVFKAANTQHRVTTQQAPGSLHADVKWVDTVTQPPC